MALLRRLSFWRAFALAAALACGLQAGAQELKPVPTLAARVMDPTATLGATDRQALEEKLAEFEKAKGTQIAVLMVPTTAPEDIAAYANRVANAWKIGRRGVGDGVLVLVAKDDRKVRIEVAKTLEGAVPDLAAKRIIDEAITPRFRQGDYAGGLSAAVDQLIARINGEALPAPEPEGDVGYGDEDGSRWINIALFLFVAVPFAAAALRGVFGRKIAAILTGTGAGAAALFFSASMVIAAVVAFIALLFTLFSTLGGTPGRRGGWSSPGWSGGGFGGGGWSGGSSSSSDSFSSGGGGDFGGGGASGDW